MRELRPERGNDQNSAPGLYLVPTPIGNARDITLRALDVLRNCDLIAAEDTRVTAKLLAIYGLKKPVACYNDHNAARERPRLLARLGQGASVALVSDAGTPLISDPGFKLVKEAVASNISVHALPGASSVLSALVTSGLPTDRFFFAGFLSAKTGERRRVLAELQTVDATLVFFESAQRLAESLADMADILGHRNAAVAREMTKLHEEIQRGDLALLAAKFGGQPPKGEIVVVVGPPKKAEPDFTKAEALLAKSLPFMPLSAAADLVAQALDLSRREVYQRALDMQGEK